MLTAVLILLLVLLAVFGYLYVHHHHRRLPRFLSAHDKSLVHVQWHELEQHMKQGGATKFRHVLIEADKLVDYCLRQLEVPGETMGDRLRAGRDKFSDYEGLWAAHKVRNQIVHEVDKKLLSFETKQQMARFKQALKDLGAL